MRRLGACEMQEQIVFSDDVVPFPRTPHLINLGAATDDDEVIFKTAGKDAAADKPTYVSLLGLEQAQQLAEKLYADSLAALDASGLNTTATAALRALAGLVVQRKN